MPAMQIARHLAISMIAIASCYAQSSAASGQEVSRSAAWSDGHADRLKWENWIAAQTGEYRNGAEYWASHRSVPDHKPCSGYDSQTVGSNWTEGCSAALALLAPMDVRRKSERDYKQGFNASIDQVVAVKRNENKNTAEPEGTETILPLWRGLEMIHMDDNECPHYGNVVQAKQLIAYLIVIREMEKDQPKNFARGLADKEKWYSTHDDDQRQEALYYGRLWKEQSITHQKALDNCLLLTKQSIGITDKEGERLYKNTFISPSEKPLADAITNDFKSGDNNITYILGLAENCTIRSVITKELNTTDLSIYHATMNDSARVSQWNEQKKQYRSYLYDLMRKIAGGASCSMQ